MTGYIYVGCAIVICILSGAVAWLYDDVQDLTADLATEKLNVEVAKEQVKDLNEDIIMLEQQREQDQKSIDDLSESYNDLQDENDENLATLNSYRSRLKSVAVAKPGLVGRRATAATNRLFDEFRTSTGGKARETDNAVPSAETESGESAEGN